MRNPMLTDGGTKSPVDLRFITGLSPVYQRDEKRSLFLAADQWNEAFLSLETLFMQGMSENGGTKPAVEPQLNRGLSAGREALFVPGC